MPIRQNQCEIIAFGGRLIQKAHPVLAYSIVFDVIFGLLGVFVSCLGAGFRRACPRGRIRCLVALFPCVGTGKANVFAYSLYLVVNLRTRL